MNPPSRPAVVVMLVFAVVILLGRVRLSDAPLHSDICAYAMIGHEMTHGRLLYTDLWERKPPLLYATFAAAEQVTGYGPNEIFLLDLIAPLISLLLIYFAGKSCGGNVAGGLLAAGFWTLMCADLDLAANQPDPEVFINVFLTAAVLLMLNWPRHRWVIASVLFGSLLAAASLYKHNMIIVCSVLLVAHLVNPFADTEPRPPRQWLESIIAGFVILCVWLTLFGYFAARGRFHDMTEVLFHQNAAYSGDIAHNLLASTKWHKLFPWFMVWALGPALLVILQILFTLRLPRVNINNRKWMISLSWAIGTWPTIALTGYDYPHYYQLWLPIWCIGGGWAGAALLGTQLRVPSMLKYGAVIGVLLILAFREETEFFLTPQQWVHRQFPYFNLVEKTQLANYLGQLLKPDEQFWELGEDNDLYFLSHHSPPTGLLYIDPLLYGDQTGAYWQRLMNDLHQKKPVLVVLADDWTKFFNLDAPVFPWLRQNYQRCETPIGWPYQLWARRGSDLKLRVEQPRRGGS